MKVYRASESKISCIPMLGVRQVFMALSIYLQGKKPCTNKTADLVHPTQDVVAWFSPP